MQKGQSIEEFVTQVFQKENIPEHQKLSLLSCFDNLLKEDEKYNSSNDESSLGIFMLKTHFNPPVTNPKHMEKQTRSIVERFERFTKDYSKIHHKNKEEDVISHHFT